MIYADEGDYKTAVRVHLVRPHQAKQIDIKNVSKEHLTRLQQATKSLCGGKGDALQCLMRQALQLEKTKAPKKVPHFLTHIL